MNAVRWYPVALCSDHTCLQLTVYTYRHIELHRTCLLIVAGTLVGCFASLFLINVATGKLMQPLHSVLTDDTSDVEWPYTYAISCKWPCSWKPAISGHTIVMSDCHNGLASLPSLSHFFSFDNTQKRKSSEKQGRPGNTYHLSCEWHLVDARWT